jgi:hypothetical protein
VKAQVPCFFAGHDHLYDRMKVEPQGGGFAIRQIVAGTSGAPSYPTTAYFPGKSEPGADLWQATEEFHMSGGFGYVVMKIEGKQATLTFKARGPDGYVAVDQWSYSGEPRVPAAAQPK